MALLAFHGVSMRFPQAQSGVRERVALHDVTFDVDTGEVVAVVGRRRSGRTTLLEVAGGILQPSDGHVTFDDVDLASRHMVGVRGGISYCSTMTGPIAGDTVLDHVAAPLLANDLSLVEAQARAHGFLRRVGASDCADIDAGDLEPAEAIRVAAARALITQPRLMLVDDPALGVRLSDRDTVLMLFQEFARDDGISVLMTVDNGTELAGCDRAMSIDTGEVRGETTATSAPVIPFPQRHADAPG